MKLTNLIVAVTVLFAISGVSSAEVVGVRNFSGTKVVVMDGKNIPTTIEPVRIINTLAGKIVVQEVSGFYEGEPLEVSVILGWHHESLDNETEIDTFTESEAALIEEIIELRKKTTADHGFNEHIRVFTLQRH